MSECNYQLLCGTVSLIKGEVNTLTFEYTGNTYLLPSDWTIEDHPEHLIIKDRNIHNEADLYTLTDGVSELRIVYEGMAGYLLPKDLDVIYQVITLPIERLKILPDEDDDLDQVTIDYDRLYNLLDSLNNLIAVYILYN